jgi:hypothetical protein
MWRIVLVALLFFSPPALAQSDGGVASPWRIGAIPNDLSERSAPIGAILWRQPLNAAALVTLQEDAVADDGTRLLSAGDELFQIVINNNPIYCENTPPKPTGLSKMMFGGGKLADKSAICVLDNDRDGRFDNYVRKKIQFEGIPIVRNPFEHSPKPLQPLKYQLRPAGSGLGQYWVGVRYASGQKPSEPLSFELVFGDHKDSSKLTERIAGSKGEFPRLLDVLGGKVTLLSVSDGVLRYRVEQIMPDQPFGIVRTIQYR